MGREPGLVQEVQARSGPVETSLLGFARWRSVRRTRPSYAGNVLPKGIAARIHAGKPSGLLDVLIEVGRQDSNWR